MFDKAQLRGKSLPASMLLDCKYSNFCLEFQKTSEKKSGAASHSTCVFYRLVTFTSTLPFMIPRMMRVCRHLFKIPSNRRGPSCAAIRNGS